MALNFNNINKKKFNVTLNDDKNTTLILLNPSKKIMDNLIELHKNSGDTSEDDQIDSLYCICSDILSRNINRVKITKETVEELFDIEDIQILLDEYFKFVSNQVVEKN